MDRRKKHFARLRAEEQRRKPPTKAQKRNQMCTYLKNMDGFTHSQLKNKSFDEVQKAFDKTMGIRRKRIDDDQEEAEMKNHIEIVVDEEEIAVDAIPLGPIPRMTPTQALTAIQTMVDHSQKWHDGTSSRNISSSSNNSNVDGLAVIVRPHLNKECPLNEEVNPVEEVKYDEFGCPAPFNRSNEAKFHSRTTNGAPSSSTGQCKVVNVDHETPNIPISLTQNNEERTIEVLQYKLPPKEQNPGNFTLPCTIGDFNFYVMADLRASVNVMPRADQP
ncbi:hypothetical protein Tco_0494945 [Tanacetum coccineum]